MSSFKVKLQTIDRMAIAHRIILKDGSIEQSEKVWESDKYVWATPTIWGKSIAIWSTA